MCGRHLSIPAESSLGAGAIVPVTGFAGTTGGPTADVLKEIHWDDRLWSRKVEWIKLPTAR